MDKKDTITLRAPDEGTVRQLGNAIATLSRERGRNLRFAKVGLSLAPLTPEQSAELALQSGTGLLVTDVFVGGSAEKAGVRFLDVVLDIDGLPVKTQNELIALTENKKNVNFRILRRDGNASVAGNARSKRTVSSILVNLE